MIQFYAPDINFSSFLPESESGHAIRVLRMHKGDELTVVDGRGNVYTCRLVDENHRKAAVEIVNAAKRPPVWNHPITIAVAPTKNVDRMEWLVEKLVEVGVDRIVPVRCRRSERKDIKRERLEKIAVSAMKQSLKAVLPQVSETISFKDFISGCDASQRFMGYCDDECERKNLACEYNPSASVAMLIGPEGDFAPEEVEMAIRTGFVPVTMGDNRLRTETAALMACATCHIISQHELCHTSSSDNGVILS